MLTVQWYKQDVARPGPHCRAVGRFGLGLDSSGGSRRACYVGEMWFSLRGELFPNSGELPPGGFRRTTVFRSLSNDPSPKLGFAVICAWREGSSEETLGGAGGQGVMTSGEDSGGGRWVGARGDEAEGQVRRRRDWVF